MIKRFQIHNWDIIVVLVVVSVGGDGPKKAIAEVEGRQSKKGRI